MCGLRYRSPGQPSKVPTLAPGHGSVFTVFPSETSKAYGDRCSDVQHSRDPIRRHITIEFWAGGTDLQIVRARARDGLEDIRRAFRQDGLQLRGALDEEEPRKAERVHAQRLAGHREPVRLAAPREHVQVSERQHHVVR